MGRISRQRMEEIIRGGGSVMVGGEIVSAIEDLPGEMALTQGEITMIQALSPCFTIQEIRRSLFGLVE